MTTLGSKRTAADDSLQNVQAANQEWWTRHTMSYDWNERIGIERYSSEWFDEADRRFIHGARLFAHGSQPFDKIIPFHEISGKRVLEIGCGMGYHSELMVRAGAQLTSIDISETSVMATRKRFELRGLLGTVQQMDAVKLDFPDAHFDFVWSWGVIHHSAQTALITKEIARVLRKGGEVRLMVYNLNGMPAYITLIMNYLIGFWRGKTLDECLWSNTDGFMARYYSSDMLSDLMNVNFSSVTAKTFGQDADAVPLPRRLRYPILRLMSKQRVADLANKRGSFLFVTAQK